MDPTTPTLVSPEQSDGTPPLFSQPYNAPDVSPPTVSYPQTVPEPPASPARSKLLIAVLVIAGVQLLVIIVLAVALTASPKANPVTKTNSAADTGQSTSGPQAATALGTQQANDSISQDVTNLNDDHDLPANKFDDKALGL